MSTLPIWHYAFESTMAHLMMCASQKWKDESSGEETIINVKFIHAFKGNFQQGDILPTFDPFSHDSIYKYIPAWSSLVAGPVAIHPSKWIYCCIADLVLVVIIKWWLWRAPWWIIKIRSSCYHWSSPVIHSFSNKKWIAEKMVLENGLIVNQR